jgi:hypothetical protein
VGDRFCVLIALGVRHGQHVDGVVVIRVLVTDQAQMRDRLVVLPSVDREGRCVKAFVDRLWSGLALRGLSLTNIEVEPHAFVQLAFFRVLPQDRFQQVGRLLIGVALERLQSTLVKRDRLEIRGAALGRGRT